MSPVVKVSGIMESSSSNNNSDDNVRPPSVQTCDVCREQPWKYRCPKCAYRTCSLSCSKKHKEDLQCSGQRNESFDVLKRVTDYTPSVAVGDQKFLDSVTECLNGVVESSSTASCMQRGEKAISDISNQQTSQNTNISHDVPQKDYDVNKEKESDLELELDKREGNDGADNVEGVHRESLGDEKNREEWRKSVTEFYLLTNARKRRIWLSVTSGKDECSRHEQFSDTIYWTITLIFRREEGESSDKQIIDYNYEVKRIPESIAVATLLRQFIKPRKIGPVVNQADLDAVKMQPFQEAGMDGLMVYMPVPLEDKQRFYVVDPARSILDNTRNRYITNHPTFIVTLNNQFNDYVMLSEQEAQELAEIRRQKMRAEDQGDSKFFNNRGRGRFGNRRFMSRGGAIGRGGGKRSFEYGPDGCFDFKNQGFKRGRSQRGNFFGRGHRKRDQELSKIPATAFEGGDKLPQITARANNMISAWSQAVENKTKLRNLNTVEQQCQRDIQYSDH